MGEFRELVAVVFLSRTWLYYSTCLRSEYLQREGNMPVSAKTVQRVRSVGHQNRGRASSSRRVAAVAGENTLGGVVFSPFDEVEGSLKLVREGAKAANVSLARQNFSAACESALNEQISIEFNVSYVYAAMHAYFDRDNVALPGLAKFFLESSHEEREHAEMLMKYQNERGGRVKFSSLLPPQTEFGGDKENIRLCRTAKTGGRRTRCLPLGFTTRVEEEEGKKRTRRRRRSFFFVFLRSCFYQNQKKKKKKRIHT